MLSTESKSLSENKTDQNLKAEISITMALPLDLSHPRVYSRRPVQFHAPQASEQVPEAGPVQGPEEAALPQVIALPVALPVTFPVQVAFHRMQLIVWCWEGGGVPNPPRLSPVDLPLGGESREKPSRTP